MKFSVWIKRVTPISLILVLVACGQSEEPIAFQPIHPEYDETGFMLKLLNGKGPVNLLEAIVKQGVPVKVAAEALSKYDQFGHLVNNETNITMIDFTQHSSKKRMYVIDRTSGKVDAMVTAHGVNSDPDKDGIADRFSNIPDSRMSSLGAYLISERYVGKFGASMRLDGLESTNDKARPRAIVLHPSHYVKDGRPRQGLSWGCPAVPYARIESLIPRLRDGSFMYIFGDNKFQQSSEDIFFAGLSMEPEYRWTDEAEEAPEHGYLSPEELAAY